MFSIVLWGKKKKTFSVVPSSDVFVSEKKTKVKWGKKWFTAEILISDGIFFLR